MTRDEVVAYFNDEWRTAAEAGLTLTGYTVVGTAVAAGLLERRPVPRHDPRRWGPNGHGTLRWEYRRAQNGRRP